MKRSMFLLVVLLCVGQLASASVISNVDRTKGQDGDRSPIGEFDANTDPLPTQSGGLKDGNIVYSDRAYGWSNTPAELIGYEYVRTFNTDKDGKELLINYAVTISEPAVLAIALDDRILESYGDNGLPDVEGEEFATLLEAVELITRTWYEDGLFVDSGLDVYVHENDTTDRALSVMMTTEPMAAGTYDFGLHPTGKNFYVIGAVPEPATLALLGLGGLVLRRRRK